VKKEIAKEQKFCGPQTNAVQLWRWWAGKQKGMDRFLFDFFLCNEKGERTFFEPVFRERIFHHAAHRTASLA
jgi:hypothetical protein